MYVDLDLKINHCYCRRFAILIPIRRRRRRLRVLFWIPSSGELEVGTVFRGIAFFIFSLVFQYSAKACSSWKMSTGVFAFV